MKKLAMILLFCLFSFSGVRFGYCETTEAKPIEYIEQQGELIKQVNIKADVNVEGDLKCKNFRSKTTDKLIACNIVLGVIVLILIF